MKLKLEKMLAKGKRAKRNVLFRKCERQFYRNVNESKSRTGKFRNFNELMFWRGIWEDEKVTQFLEVVRGNQEKKELVLA